MYKKYCLIASILLIIPLFTTAMEVEEEKQQRTHILEMITGRSFFPIHIQTNDNRTFIFPSNHPLFSQSTFFRSMMEGGFKEKGTKANPIILQSINGNQFKLIVEFIKIKTKPTKPTKPLKQYLQDFDINKLIELTNINKLSQLLEATNFLGVKGLFESIVPYFIKQLQNLDINALNELIMKKAFISVNGVLELIVPHLVKQLQNPEVLDAWLKEKWNELLDENKELSDLIRQNLTNKIKPTPQYLQKKKSIPFDILSGHKGDIYSVAFSSDGKMLASGGADKTIKLWDIKTGKVIHTFIGHKGIVYSVRFSPNGKTLASGSEDETIKLWNIETGTDTHTFIGHKSSVYSVAFSPDGTTLASGSAKTIKLWNMETYKEIHTFREISTFHLSPEFREFHTYSVVFSPNGKILASGSMDMTIKLWNIETGKEIPTSYRHNGQVLSVVFSPNGKILASGSMDMTIKLWNIETGKEIRTLFTGHNFVYSVVFNTNGTILAAGSEHGTIKLWNVKTGTEIRTFFTGHKDFVRSVAFNPYDTILASGLRDGTIRLWHLIDLQDIEQLSILELLLIHAWQHAGIINLQTYQELNTIYNQASGLVKKLIKTLTSQPKILIPPPEKTWWQRLIPWKK